MPTVRDILATKGSQVHTIPATATTLEAIEKMNLHRIGALVVTDQKRIAGMFTERDVLQRVVACQRPPGEITVGEVMSENVLAVTLDTDIDDASQIMRDRRVRHLPVVDGEGGLLGLISIGDVNACHASTQAATICFLHDYIYGRV